MAGIVIASLLALWLVGVIQVPGIVVRDMRLFRIAGHWVTLLELLVFVVMLWAIETLPSPLREIAVLAVILWLLSTLGIIVVAGLSNIIIVALIVGLAVTYLGHSSKPKDK